jgi:chaperonin cofactor prefoldin
MPEALMLISLTLLPDLQNTVASRQKLEGQRQENLGVQKVRFLLTISELLGAGKLTTLEEFENIGEDEVIYKLVGPVLLKQETFEAESTVKGRLDFIGGEMYVTTPCACESLISRLTQARYTAQD